jgi:hypothetical protein
VKSLLFLTCSSFISRICFYESFDDDLRRR